MNNPIQINLEPPLSSVGGKAFQLYRLKECYNVPPFFVISFESPDQIDYPTVQQAIVQESQTQGFDMMAVRSSAGVEDSPHASFAGMFKTVLGARPPDLITAIRAVLDSTQSERVADYCLAQGFDPGNIRMAVIVQRIVQSRVAGVCFTRFQESRDSLIIEACYGLGEALVSGRVSPDSYIVDRRTLAIEDESIGYQKVALNVPVSRGEKPTFERVPFHKRNARKLTREEIKLVAETCLSVEQHLSLHAADVEWAFEGDELYILQARPYTGVSPSMK